MIEANHPIHMAMIGATDWVAQYHLPTLRYLAQQANIVVRGIWNRTISKAEFLAKEFGIPKVYRSLSELIDDQALDCISIAISSAAVMDIIRQLSERTLPLICEKPPGKDSQEAKLLSELVAVPNVVAFNRRYTPLNQHFKRLIDRQPTIHFAECHFYRRDRDDPHFVTETGIHGINLLEYFFGTIARVDAKRWYQADKKNFNWLAEIEFMSGVCGIIKFFPFAGVNMESIEAHGSDLSVYLYAAQNYTDDVKSRIVINENSPEGQLRQKILEEEEANPLITGGFVAEYEDFFKAVVTGKPTISNFQNAWTSVEIAEIISSGQSAAFSGSL
jgi:predicted dehydrogenase